MSAGKEKEAKQQNSHHDGNEPRATNRSKRKQTMMKSEVVEADPKTDD